MSHGRRNTVPGDREYCFPQGGMSRVSQHSFPGTADCFPQGGEVPRPPEHDFLRTRRTTQQHWRRMNLCAATSISIGPGPPQVHHVRRRGGGALSTRGVAPTRGSGHRSTASDPQGGRRAEWPGLPPPSLVRRQQENILLGQVWQDLERGAVQATVWIVRGVLSFEVESGKLLIANSKCVVANIPAFVHTLHGHVRVGTTLPLIRDHLH